MVEEVKALCSASPQAIAAVVLGTIAAAIGPKVVLNRGRRRCSPMFNVIVSHRSPRTLPWMDAVTAPFAGRVFDLQADLTRQGTKGIEHDNRRRRQVFEQARHTVQPRADLLAHLQAEASQSSARLQPFAATTGVAPKELAGLLPRAFDGGVTLVTASNDPAAEFVRLKPAERAHLAQLLNRSWTTTPLAFGQEVLPGAVHLLWSTRQPLQTILGGAGFDPALVAVPTLVFADDTAGAELPPFNSESRWDQTVAHFFEHRCLNKEATFSMHPDAEALVTDFDKLLAAHDAVPPAVRPYLSWLPELAARVAMIYHVVTGHEEPVIDAAIVGAALEMTKWIGRQHITAVACAVRIDSADLADNQAKLLAKVRARAPITRRDLRRTFENQRVQWFDAALDALLEAKKVHYNDKMLLVPCS